MNPERRIMADDLALDVMSEWLISPDGGGEYRSAADLVDLVASLVYATGRPIDPVVAD